MTLVLNYQDQNKNGKPKCKESFYSVCIMSEDKPNIKQHLNVVNNITQGLQQYTQIIQYFDTELNKTITRVSSIENSIKNIESILHKHQTQQSELIDRIASIEQTLHKNNNQQNNSSKSEIKSLNPNALPYKPSINTSSKTLLSQHKQNRNKHSNNDNKANAVQLSDDAKSLIQTMKKYANNTLNTDELNIKQILNQFLYVIKTYNDTQHFDAICKAVGAC
eukprot:98211_1